MDIKLNEIYSIKLLSGEEMIAKFVGITDDYYQVEAPLGVGAGPQGLQLMPAMFTTDQNPYVSITKSAVALIAETREDVRGAYEQSVNPSEIFTPNKQIITG